MSALVKSYLNLCKQDILQRHIILGLRSMFKVSSTPEDKQEIKDEIVTDPEEELRVERLRNKSRLRIFHHNILFNKKPYSEPITKTHFTVKYNRRIYGKYGSESGVNPGIMWPTKTDLETRREYEKIAYPFTIEEMVNAAKKHIEEKELKTQKAHDRVVANFAKLNDWKKELKLKIAKREADAIAIKEKKDKLIEEVRRHFGFTVDPRDERFQEMLAVKEKEQKKKEKQAKMDAREKKALEKLMEKNKEHL